MMRKDLPHAEHILDLMADEAVYGLSDADSQRLESYFREHPEHDRDGLMEAAAAVELLGANADEPLPNHLRANLIASFKPADVGAGSSPASPTAPAAPRPPEKASDVRVLELRQRLSLAWWATAAAIVLAALGWFRAISPTAMPPMQPTLEAVLAAADVQRASWSGLVDDYRGVSGDVVWSDEQQFGYMRLVGLPANDPAVAQYQLWIVDPSRDAEPVDGGVFDMPTVAGEVRIPIDAKLPVDDPTTFAITLEQPGGVVVSEGPLLVAASMGS